MAWLAPSYPCICGVTHVSCAPIIIGSSTCIFNNSLSFSIHFLSLVTVLTINSRHARRRWIAPVIGRPSELRSSLGDSAIQFCPLVIMRSPDRAKLCAPFNASLNCAYFLFDGHPNSHMASTCPGHPKSVCLCFLRVPLWIPEHLDEERVIRSLWS